MRVKIAIAILCLLAFTAATAYATTIRVSDSNYANLGWKKTTILAAGGEAGQQVGFRGPGQGTLPDNAEGVHPICKKTDSTHFNWASLSMNFANGIQLDTITTLKIRVTGYEGDGTSWEPPSVFLGVTKDGTNSRNLRALPYATYGRGTAKTFYTYDLLGSCKWQDSSSALVRTWTSTMAWIPDARLDCQTKAWETVTRTGVTWQTPSRNNFEIFEGATMNEDTKYSSSARGTVDWVEIGFADGTNYVFDFVVPEPASFLALLTGALGILAVRRRR